MAEQDALLEALQALTEKTSHAILSSGSLAGLSERSGVVWNAWHAVRSSYRSSLSPSRVEGMQAVTGFDAQVRAGTHAFALRQRLLSSCLVRTGIFFGVVMCFL